MLILVRKIEQGIWINGDILVKIIGIERDRVRIGISAPSEVNIVRQELLASDEVDSLTPGYQNREGFRDTG